MRPLTRLFRFLASLKLAVILLAMLMVILAAATYYESIYDTKTAQHLVYRSVWFGVFLLLLGVNVFCAAAVRYPFKLHQTGFVMTHAGILVILAGSVVTMVWGVDGSLGLVEGDSSSVALLDEPVLRVVRGEEARELQAEFRWDPPADGKERRLDLGYGMTAVVDRYHHQAAEIKRYEPGSGAGAIKFRLKGRMADAEDWLQAGSSPLKLGPATLTLRQGQGEAEEQAFLRGGGSKDQGALQILVGQEPFQVEIRDLPDTPVPLGETGHTLQLVRYLPHAVVRDGALISLSEEAVNPVVEVRFQAPSGDQESYLLFGFLSDLNALTSRTGAALPLKVLYNVSSEPANRKAGMDMLLTRDGRLLYRLSGGQTGALAKGASIQTGWMDFEFTLTELIPAAKLVKEYRPLKLVSGQEGPGAAIRLRVEGARDDAPQWIRQGDGVMVEPVEGGEPVRLGYGYRAVDLGFTLTLKDFQIGYDPGTKNPASYSSQVLVQGSEEPVTIQMNEPLQRNGFTFFQSSFQEINGEPMVSIFSVARDPGIEVKYLGSILLVLGIAVHFYLRPALLRRSQRQALERLRGEESA